MNTKNKIFLILFLVFSVASFSFGASSQQAVFVPDPNLPTGNPSGYIIIKGNDQLNNSPLQYQFLNFTLNVQSPAPLTLNLSTDKSQYQVGESAKYTISGTALPQNPSNYQTITAVIYAVAHPPGRGGCANGCNVTFTYLNGSWSVYGNQFTSSDVGNWTVRVTYNNTQSNDVSYSVLSSSPPPPPPSSTPTANLTINDVTSRSFRVGDSWTLRITSNLPNKEVTICTEPPSPTGYSCTPAVNLGFSRYTDSNGNWTANGTFGSDSVGTWKEYAKVGNATSNDIYFTVSTNNQPPQNQTSTPPNQPPTQPTFWVFPTSLNLTVGKPGEQLEAYYDPDGSGPQAAIIVTNNTNWSSNNPFVATIGNSASWFINKGYVTPISQGQAIITATYNNLSAYATVTVNVNSTSQRDKYKCVNYACVLAPDGNYLDYYNCSVNCSRSSPGPSSGTFDLQATDQSPPNPQTWYDTISTTINPGQTKRIYARYLIPFIGNYTYWIWCNESSTSTNYETISQNPNFSGSSYSLTDSQYQEYALWCNYTNAGNYSMKMIVRNDKTNGSYQDIVPITIKTSTPGNSPRYKCSGSSCVRDDLKGEYTTSNCNNECSGGGGGGENQTNEFILTVGVNPPRAGTVNVNPPNNNINSTNTFSYSTSTPVTLKVVSSSPGYTFQGWGGDCSSFGTSTICRITVDNNKKTVTAVFKTRGTIREIIPFRPPSLNEFLKQTASIFFGWR